MTNLYNMISSTRLWREKAMRLGLMKVTAHVPRAAINAVSLYFIDEALMITAVHHPFPSRPPRSYQHQVLRNILHTDVPDAPGSQVAFSISRVANESYPPTSSTTQGSTTRVRDH